jgi:hypothetical protein
LVQFADFVLSHLPSTRQRVLEVGCGREGGVVAPLAAAGHDVVAIDPEAPEGPAFRRVALEELDDPGPFDAVVAGRVLHHVHPLGPALDKIARLAPLLIVDEFAWNHMDAATSEWYEREHRRLVSAGRDPKGPPDLDEWRAHHPDLHPYETLRAELDARYDERYLEWRPYLYRWLGESSEAVEASLIATGTIRPLGVRYVGRAKRPAARLAWPGKRLQ